MKISIKEEAKLSINAFPLIEAYAGAPINKIAENNKWPVITEKAKYGDKEMEYIVSYLPINEEMRTIVENN